MSLYAIQILSSRAPANHRPTSKHHFEIIHLWHAKKEQFSKLLDRIRNTEIQLDTFERANQKQEVTIVKLRKMNRQLEWDLEREKLQENCFTWQNWYKAPYVWSGANLYMYARTHSLGAPSCEYQQKDCKFSPSETNSKLWIARSRKKWGN